VSGRSEGEVTTRHEQEAGGGVGVALRSCLPGLPERDTSSSVCRQTLTTARWKHRICVATAALWNAVSQTFQPEQRFSGMLLRKVHERGMKDKDRRMASSTTMLVIHSSQSVLDSISSRSGGFVALVQAQAAD